MVIERNENGVNENKYGNHRNTMKSERNGVIEMSMWQHEAAENVWHQLVMAIICRSVWRKWQSSNENNENIKRKISMKSVINNENRKA
jgi:hypothetical protein